MKLPDASGWTSLLDAVDDAATRIGESPLFFVRRGEVLQTWSANDMARRSRFAAWRLAAAGVGRGEPLLAIAPSGPALGCLYVAAWRAGVIPVPLDARFTPDVIRRVAARANAKWLVIPDQGAKSSELGELIEDMGDHVLSLDRLLAEPDATFPSDWAAQLDAWPRPLPEDVFMIMYTSGTTGNPRGVPLRHRQHLANFRTMRAILRVVLLLNRGELRGIAVMPLTHIMGFNAFITTFAIGVRVLYPESLTPRALIREMRAFRPSVMPVAPQFLELIWRQFVRDVAATGNLEAFERKRARASRLPYWVRRRMFRKELELIGGSLKMWNSSAAFLPPDVQGAWESVGIPVIQGYGSTESGAIAATSRLRHPIGKVGRIARDAAVELAADGEILVKSPSVTSGYWRDPEATQEAWDDQGRYHTGDIGQFDAKGNLVLIGRKRNIIVRPDGLNVYPEDIEQALHAAGLGDTVVLETAPGRIEAVVLDPERDGAGVVAGDDASPEARRAAIRERVDAALRAANATLTMHERVDAWKLWPEADFPRTHTAKIRRDRVREWAEESSGAVPLPVREGV